MLFRCFPTGTGRHFLTWVLYFLSPNSSFSIKFKHFLHQSIHSSLSSSTHHQYQHHHLLLLFISFITTHLLPYFIPTNKIIIEISNPFHLSHFSFFSLQFSILSLFSFFRNHHSFLSSILLIFTFNNYFLLLSLILITFDVSLFSIFYSILTSSSSFSIFTTVSQRKTFLSFFFQHFYQSKQMK